MRAIRQPDCADKGRLDLRNDGGEAGRGRLQIIALHGEESRKFGRIAQPRKRGGQSAGCRGGRVPRRPQGSQAAIPGLARTSVQAGSAAASGSTPSPTPRHPGRAAGQADRHVGAERQDRRGRRQCHPPKARQHLQRGSRIGRARHRCPRRWAGSFQVSVPRPVPHRKGRPPAARGCPVRHRGPPPASR